VELWWPPSCVFIQHSVPCLASCVTAIHFAGGALPYGLRRVWCCAASRGVNLELGVVVTKGLKLESLLKAQWSRTIFVLVMLIDQHQDGAVC
jgi:hypothetical protein